MARLTNTSEGERSLREDRIESKEGCKTRRVDAAIRPVERIFPPIFSTNKLAVAGDASEIGNKAKEDKGKEHAYFDHAHDKLDLAKEADAKHVHRDSEEQEHGNVNSSVFLVGIPVADEYRNGR